MAAGRCLARLPGAPGSRNGWSGAAAAAGKKARVVAKKRLTICRKAVIVNRRDCA